MWNKFDLVLLFSIGTNSGFLFLGKVGWDSNTLHTFFLFSELNKVRTMFLSNKLSNVQPCLVKCKEPMA